MRPYHFAAATAVALLVLPPPTNRPISGFSVAAGRAERQWEARFRAVPDPDSLREHMRILSARPHHVGSVYDSINAEWILHRFMSWGLDAHIETFQVLFPTPKERLLELVAPSRFRASLRETPVAGDPTSAQQTEQLPTYNAYSADGDVTAPLVFVNYGIPEDYDRLERLGISVKGAIVIAKYGHSWRGIKPKLAQEHGAVGCIIYSDPQDDGYHGGDTYPRGPWRPSQGVQRGSVADMPLFSGDPLTPGVGATADAKRLPRSESPLLMKIPVLPISYADAQPLLAAIRGRVAPRDWQGGLPITYHVGPGPARVHLKLAFDWSLKPIRDVIARIPGTDAADEWIVRGNHYDAWVNGADDPISGQVALLEEARGLATLLKDGWKPRRTIIYAAWDGEEPGLLGSTEWVETHAEELQAHAVAYFNTDGNGRGYLNVGASHSLQAFLNDVARDITDPETGLPVWKRTQLRRIRDARSEKQRDTLRTSRDLPVGALGSGSDYTPFLQHLGIAAANLGYGGEDGGGIYHSIYDDFHWYTTYSDTAFVYGRALAQTVGTAILRMADADLLPFDFLAQAGTFRGYLKELQELAQRQRDSIEEQNRQIAEGVFAATNDPRRPQVAPDSTAVPPHLNFAPLANALDRLDRSARRYQAAVQAAQSDSGKVLEQDGIRQVNDLLRQTEQALASGPGLPGRPWYRHLIYAPGLYTGYGVKTIPGVREAIEQQRWDLVEPQMQVVSGAISAEAELIDRAASLLEGMKQSDVP